MWKNEFNESRDFVQKNNSKWRKVLEFSHIEARQHF